MSNTSNSYNLKNTIERQHLITLANRLTDDQLSHPLEAGWTISGVLAHLAFWDRRAVVLLEQWQRAGHHPSPLDVDVVNETTRVLCNAIAPRAAAQLAVACAEEIDAAIDHLAPALLAEVETIGRTVHLDRAEHRHEHLTQIERALGLIE